MKRPISIYFIAAWSFVVLMVIVNRLSRLLGWLLPDGPARAEWSGLSILPGLVFLFAIWHVVRLIQLKPFNRWFTIVILAWWTLASTWASFAVLPRLENPLGPAAVLLIYTVLNLASIWFLVRRKFREFAVAFVAERLGQTRAVCAGDLSKKSEDEIGFAVNQTKCPNIKKGILWFCIVGGVVGSVWFGLGCWLSTLPSAEEVSQSPALRPWWSNWSSALFFALATGLPAGVLAAFRPDPTNTKKK